MTRTDPYARERELDDEIRVHLEMAVRERMARGEARERAERAALAEFGDVESVKSAARLAWGLGSGGRTIAACPTANDRLKESFRSWFWAAMILAAVLHTGVFALWPEMASAVDTLPRRELDVIPMPDIPIPAPPEALTQPAKPIPVEVEIAEDVTIAPNRWQDDLSTLPPPPAPAASDLSDAPRFTPHTVRPEILNRVEVARAMEREYPPLLRDANIGGTVQVYFFVDEGGAVRDRRLQESSGYSSLDQAALEVAGIFRFSPALNRDQKVPVWVLLPIVFRVQ